MGQGRRGIRGADQREGALGGRVGEGGEGVGERAETVGDAVIDVTVKVGSPQEAVNYL
jgi:hypothetical protein